MGVRTYFNGIRIAKDFKHLVKRRDAENPYTSYGALAEKFHHGEVSKEQVLANLTRKLDDGFISLEELLSEGRATRLFQHTGLFDAAVKKLAVRKAFFLQRDQKQLDKFLISGKDSVPYVVEYLPADEIAEALHRVSQPVQQRSVIDLVKIASIPPRYDDNMAIIPIKFALVYDEKEITTEYLPYDAQKIFCFKREAKAVKCINRGLVITDRFVANTPEILDALDALQTSPLDCILISLRRIQGILYPSSLSTILLWPTIKRDEFIPRDHFTRKVKQILHEEVCRQFETMQENGGDPLSFRVYIRRLEKGEYTVDFIWDKGRKEGI